MTQAIGLDGSEQLEIVQYGETKRTTTGAIALLADFGDADPSVDDLEYVFGYNSSGAFKKQEPFGVVQNGANAASTATDGVSSYVALKDGAMVRGSPLSFEPITNYDAEPGADAATTTARLNIAVAAHKLLYIPAGAWRLNPVTGSDRVLWMIDPEATFPDLPTVGPFGQTDLSNLGGRIYRVSNAGITFQGIRYGDPYPWPELYRPFSVAISEFGVTSPTGEIAVGGFSRASDHPTVNQGTIGGEFIGVNDDEANLKPVFGIYTEGWRTSNNVGSALTIEAESINQGSPVDLNPFTARSLSSKDTVTYVAASGGGDILGVSSSSAAYVFWNNNAYYLRGMVAMSGSLDPTGSLEAFSMPNNYRVAWHFQTGGLGAWDQADSGQRMAQGDADASGYTMTMKRRKANNTSASDALDRIWRTNFLGYTGAGDYTGAFAQVLQRTDFSAGNARFSYDISAKNSAGADIQVTLNGVTDSAFTPFPDNSVGNGSAAARWNNTFSTNFRPGTGSVTWTSGSGTPEGSVTAAVGSLFTRTDGGASTTLYVKESGSGNTGWVAK